MTVLDDEPPFDDYDDEYRWDPDGDEIDRLRAIEEWARGADHHPGCSGGFGTSYPCKCGRREFWPDLEVADRG